MNLYCFSHLRLNRFNLLKMQRIYAERLPCRFIFPNTQDFAFAPLEKISSEKKVSVKLKSVHSNGKKKVA